jgi:hypothetical protein
MINFSDHPNLEIDPNLTEEELKELKEMLEVSKLRKQIPLEKRIPITNPDKYSFPLGMDDEGNLNVVRKREESE